MNLTENVLLLEEPWNLSRPEEEEQKLLFGIGTDNFITLLVFGLIFTLGVLGNSMVITVLARNKPGKPRSTTNIFILNLSIADLSYLLFCIPFQSTIYILPTWVLGAFICKFIHYFFTVSMLVSIFTLSAMSVDRYIAIVHSRKSSSIRVSRHALIGVLVIWVLSLAMASPIMYYQNIFHTRDNHTYCWELWQDQNQKKVYVVCMFVFGYVLPLLLITFCYAKVSPDFISLEPPKVKKKTVFSLIFLLFVFAGFKPLAQKIKKHVQKVRGFEEKGRLAWLCE